MIFIYKLASLSYVILKVFHHVQRRAWERISARSFHTPASFLTYLTAIHVTAETIMS
jgi:hypothetical protein